jgi:hypothetical protein
MAAFLGGAPGHLFKLADLVQCRQPSLSNTVLKPSGIRGAASLSGWLHRPQRAPAAPQPQAWGPSQGVRMWSSQTQPEPPHQRLLAPSGCRLRRGRSRCLEPSPLKQQPSSPRSKLLSLSFEFNWGVGVCSSAPIQRAALTRLDKPPVGPRHARCDICDLMGDLGTNR